MRIRHAMIASAAFGVCALNAEMLFAAPITFSGGSGSLHASVVFDVAGTDLKVRLVNDATSDVLVPADVLTAVFFDLPGNPTLSPVSAFLAPGSVAVNGTVPGGDAGGAWAFADGLAGAPGSAKYGISSAGFSLFGPPDVFPGADPDPNNGPDGMSFGLLSAGDDTAAGNSPILTNTFVKNSMDFVLSGLPIGFNLNSINNVRVQYGTDTSTEPSYEVVIPEPGTALLAGGAALLGLVRRRRSR